MYARERHVVKLEIARQKRTGASAVAGAGEAGGAAFGSAEARPYLQNKQSRKVLDAARDVFIQEGAAAFSARRVAKAAALGLSSVQHIFPTTEVLLAAMLEHVNDAYEAAYRESAAKLPFNPEARLAAAIDYLLEDLCDPDQRRFWLGFWSLSCHNEHAKALLQRSYRHHLSNLASFIGAAQPVLAESRCLDIAAQVAAQVEGMLVLVHIAGRKLTIRSPLLQGARQSILRLLTVPAVAPKAG
jgi:AcrR family transcriptional regulator